MACMATTEYQVTGMSCGHCEASVREELSKIGTIQQIAVSAKTGKLVITSSEPVADADVVAAVDEAGYQAVRVA
ncbi:heavy-metal-associated domain-containing protein [Smaragdicoccus niigatensis]